MTEHIQSILQRKNRRLLKKFYVTVIHVDSMDSQFLDKNLKKKRKLSPDTQRSSKLPRTVKKGKTSSRTELREGESKKRKKGHVSSNGSKQRKLSGKKQRKNLKDSRKERSEVTT